jgi:hypothetical protein
MGQNDTIMIDFYHTSAVQTPNPVQNEMWQPKSDHDELF